MTVSPVLSDDLPAKHGFFTRQGGASSGVFASLNCGIGSTDQRDSVLINRSRIAAFFDFDADALITVHQTHSADAIAVNAPSETPQKADGIATNTAGLVLGVLSADCQPVLFSDPKNGVIGAAHAGWKGALDGILEATIETMIGLGAERDQIIAAIGPSISQRAYEVGPEFLDRFVEDDPANTCFFANGAEDRYQFDLIGFGLQRLRAADIKSASWTGHCTYSDPDRFFSYRRSCHAGEADYGRHMSAISL